MVELRLSVALCTTRIIVRITSETDHRSRIMKNTTFDIVQYRLDWIDKEVDMLERKIELYDELSIKIKGWTVVSWFALISYSIKNNDWRVAGFTPLIPIVFMIAEASYKRFQMDFILRTRHIMAFLNDSKRFSRWLNEDETMFFPIYDILNIYGEGHDHNPAKQKWGSIWTPFKKASVSFLYWCLITCGIIVAILLFLFYH